jgi:hypothetical protein
MKLSSDAAIEACLMAAHHGLVIARIEGGIWHAPGFEARLDCIWDSPDGPLDEKAAEENNREAARFVEEERVKHQAFILTALPLAMRT